MENIFFKAGYHLSTNLLNSYDDKINVLQINNPDGSPRWIWNAENKKPLFLKFYNVGSFRALVFATSIKLVFLLRLQKLVFKKQSYFIKQIKNVHFDYKKNWAIFTGTVGPNNKVIVYDGNRFTKIATTKNAEQLLNNEQQTILKLKTENVSFLYPEIINNTYHSLTLTDVSKNGKRLKELNPEALKTLVELYKLENLNIKVSEWDYLNALKENFNKIKNNRIPKNIIRKVNLLLESINPDEIIELSFSHGDFTQWNMYKIDDKLALYDWELATNTKPKGFDFFHFILQNDVLVAHKPWKEIYANIQEQAKNDFYKTIFNENPEELNRYLKWYLIINCLHYLEVYSLQKDWHIQINWLLNVWNEGLNMFLKDRKTSRALLIMDVFDTLHNQDYAALKFQNGFPDATSVNSDIDLVIPKKINKEIVAFLTKHNLVSKIKISQKSFMNSLQIITHDAEILAIDLIWQLKRKNLEILDAKEILETNYVNPFGVKNASNLFTARYVVLFYILNNAKIPKKYLIYELVIQNSKFQLDKVIKDYFANSKLNKNVLISILLKNASNLKWNYVRNTFNYLIDTLKNLTSNKGFTITFSGVDGAGKTTVIENIAFRVEKQLRKPVVVLRHRPSLLPILSVWKKGKEKAHLDVLNSLPRKGTNDNFISSLFRFSYYYFDYLIGQFVVYFKYILRGYVVIYDRYYFDFINDSKRSNIVLPKSFAKIGYHFLLKPKFNFFLFADTKTILKRKQELSENTIIELTNDYNNLFQSLELHSNSVIYKSINNEDLETTLSNIIKTIIKR